MLSTLSPQLSTAFAQICSIDWFTLDGGGGRSTGGAYALNGTIGQPDAGVMSGSQFTLVGGFWSITAAIQTPDSPHLDVTRTPTNTVAVSWPATGEDWRLYVTTNLAPTAVSWTEIPPPYATNALSAPCFVEPAPAGNKFFRLQRPGQFPR